MSSIEAPARVGDPSEDSGPATRAKCNQARGFEEDAQGAFANEAHRTSPGLSSSRRERRLTPTLSQT
jgi:hypothetical protein